MRFCGFTTCALCLAALILMPLKAAPSPADEFIGGPTSIGSQLQLDDETPEDRRFSKWFSFKRDLRESAGFDFSLDYAALYQHAHASLNGNDEAFSGVFRVFGKWRILGDEVRDTGSIVWKIENRTKLGTDVAPGSLGGGLGYLGVTGTSFTDAGWFLGPLYWEQFLGDGKVGIVAGRVDSLDFVDISGYSGQWLRFQNASLLANTTIPYPDVGLGAGAGFKVADQWVFGATIHDANGSQAEVDFLVDGSEFFTQAYSSWSPSRAKRMDREVHFTVWHADERSNREIEEGWGLALSANWLFDGGWMPFVRAGWANGAAARADAAVVAGILYRPASRIGELGIAWGRESLSTDSQGDQQAVEVFFRWDVTPVFAVTPSLQVLIDPALNSSEDAIFLGGLRARMNF